MKIRQIGKSPVVFALATVILFSSFFEDQAPGEHPFKFPYKGAGLTAKEAASHLLSRFSFGTKPGQVDEVVNMGLENWFALQLNGTIPDDSLNQLLSGYDALKLSNPEITHTYPRAAQVLRMAEKEGFIKRDSLDKSDKASYRQKLSDYMQQKGIRPQQELYRQFFNQKILRAAYGQNQLQEVLTDFWFNHFNVSMTKNACASFIPAYERDAIRPHVLGKFEDLLIATAKSPAMLVYLDNFSSSAQNNGSRQAPAKNAIRQRRADGESMQPDDSSAMNVLRGKIAKARKQQGLNENYAREVMELHTLGVDGGYTQQDVTQAARVLTGWTVYPMGDDGYGAAIRKYIEMKGEDNLAERGFVHQGDFLFAATKHDDGEKTVLGKEFPAHGGYNEGVQLLEMLASRQATAQFISRKLAVRFVSDNPPQGLVEKMSKTFIASHGDIKQVLITLATSKEFWSAESLRQKTKSPFELAISAVRSLNASIVQPYQLYNRINKMGQHIYFYQAPTGFPDKSQYWINTGALLNRMNFGLALASERIPGISFNLGAVNNNHEPESAEAALETYCRIMLPGRDIDQTVRRLTPLLTDPDLLEKVGAAAEKMPVANQEMQDNNKIMIDPPADTVRVKGRGRFANMQKSSGNNSMLSQVVGIIIGSPEFQRK